MNKYLSIRDVVVAVIIAVGVPLAIVGAVVNATPAYAQSQLVWHQHSCMTLDDVKAFLDKLPPDRALEAKIVVLNSQRSFLGALSEPYYILYREEEK